MKMKRIFEESRVCTGGTYIHVYMTCIQPIDNVRGDRVQNDGGSIANINANGTFTLHTRVVICTVEVEEDRRLLKTNALNKICCSTYM